MYILNLEDNVFKHHDICDAVAKGSFGNLKIDFVRNLEDGIDAIEKSVEKGTSYDLIITDMWYPKKAGGGDAASGEVLMKRVKESGWNIPIILCSSVNYRIPEIHGCVHYSENEDWERKLVELIKLI